MNTELLRMKKFLSEEINMEISKVTEDSEARDYYGCDFEAERLNFKFRKAKITPKKNGMFVTYWKRNSQNITEPFHEKDEFDFFLIAAEENEKYGFFLFPKEVLVSQNILTTEVKEGKRGFRVYPDWTKTGNKQAEKTQIWQQKFFCDFTALNLKSIEKLKSILNLKFDY